MSEKERFLTESTTLLSVEVLKNEIETLKNRTESERVKKINKKGESMLDGWMKLIDSEYIRKEMIEAAAEGKEQVDLIRNELEDDIDYEHLYYDRIEPHSESLEERIKSFINTSTTRLFLVTETPYVRIYLIWSKESEYCPTLFYRRPCATVCSFICFILICIAITIISFIGTR